MKSGSFLPFYLNFTKETGEYATPEEQASFILQRARQLMDSGVIGVAITYSANYGQTRTIEETYARGEWHTQTDGSNQAAVIKAMENMLGGEYADIQFRVRIAPVTTMSYESPLYGATTHEHVIRQDLANIESLLSHGWTILGWQNESSGRDAFAVGGGVASTKIENGRPAFYPELEEFVQSKLKEFAVNYP